MQIEPAAKPIFAAVLPVFVAECGDRPSARKFAAHFAGQAAIMCGLLSSTTPAAPRAAKPGPQLNRLAKAAREFRAAFDALDDQAFFALPERWLTKRHRTLREIEDLLAGVAEAKARSRDTGGRPTALGRNENRYRNLLWATIGAWATARGRPAAESETAPFVRFVNRALEAAGIDELSAKQIKTRLRDEARWIDALTRPKKSTG